MRQRTVTVGFKALLLVGALLVTALPMGASEPWEVRVVSIAEYDIAGPFGLSYSEADKSLLLVSHSGAQPVVTAIDLDWDLVKSTAIDASLSDPLVVTFDNRSDRLVLLGSSSGEFLEIAGQALQQSSRPPVSSSVLAGAGLLRPRGMTSDPQSGSLFVLDAGAREIVRIDPDPDTGNLQGGEISRLDLTDLAAPNLRGLAYNPANGRLYVTSVSDAKLFELDRDGRLVGTHDLSGIELHDPHSMVFAPSGDPTDDPNRLNLYASDNRTGGKLWEISLVETAEAVPTEVASLVQTIDTSQYPSPDPAGITYLSTRPEPRLLVSDSEVNEMPIYPGFNMLEMTLSGNLADTWETLSFSNEPTGLSHNPANDHLFVSDDDRREIYEVDPGNDGQYGTADDVVTSFDTASFNSTDPEGVAYNTDTGELFIADGVGREVYRVSPGPNGVFDGVDDVVSHFDVEVLGAQDPEGIAYDADRGTLLIADRGPDNVLEITTDGTLVRVIDISATGSPKASGIVLAPGSIQPTAMNLYVTDRAVDNNSDPNENDGKIYELTNPGTSLTVTVAATDPDAAESGLDPGEFTVTRTGDTSSDLPVFYSLGGTATNGDDYELLDTSVVITIGSGSTTITVTPKDDTAEEGHETVILTLQADAAYSVGASDSASVTIVDDDLTGHNADGEVTLDGTIVSGSWVETLTADSNFEVLEEELYAGGKRSRLEHRWTFSNVSGGVSFSVKGYHSSGGVDDFDFAYSTDLSLWTPMLTLTNTNPAAPPEFFLFEAPLNGTVYVRVTDTDRSRNEGTPDTIFIDELVIGFVIGGPGLPTVSITATDASAAETGSDPGQFTVSRSDTAGSLSVFYTVSGTAEVQDYVEILDGLVIFADGQGTTVITVTPIDDQLAEGSESVILTLTPDNAYIIGSPSSDLVTVADDDQMELHADGEETRRGTIAGGSWQDTLAADGQVEILEEELYAGGKRSRLEHRWTFSNVSGGVSFSVKAYRSGAFDNFDFSYSTDLSTWTPMLTLTNTDPTAPAETFVFSAPLSGTVYVRVKDSDRSRKESTQDTLSVDKLVISR